MFYFLKFYFQKAKMWYILRPINHTPQKTTVDREVTMLVRERMTQNPVTIPPDMSVTHALRLMRERKVHHLPVLDGHGKLIGIVSDKDLLHASPSPVTSLAIWEITDLLSRLKVEKVLTPKVITVPEDMPLEEAARIMADSGIGGLPVMRDNTLVGIITRVDLFKAFLELLGGRRSGVRITVSIPGIKGTLAKIANSISGVGGDIVGLGLIEVSDTGGTNWEITFKVQDIPRDKIVEAIRSSVRDILDVRET
jgi:acetoin utilization protein AcuB